MLYPNQKRIIVGHASDIKHYEDVKESFLQPTKWAPIKEAMRLLTGNGFKLYMYLLSWDGAKDNIYNFSPAGIAKETKMSDEGARNARDELIRKGYLITHSENFLEFFHISRTEVS